MEKISVIQKLLLEVDSWTRLISFFQTENVRLKTTLSDHVNNGCGNDLVYSAESFLEEFILQDRMTGFFKDELNMHRKAVQNYFIDHANIPEEILQNHELLRLDFIKAEECFFRTRESFNAYLQMPAKI